MDKGNREGEPAQVIRVRTANSLDAPGIAFSGDTVCGTDGVGIHPDLKQ